MPYVDILFRPLHKKIDFVEINNVLNIFEQNINNIRNNFDSIVNKTNFNKIKSWQQQ